MAQMLGAAHGVARAHLARHDAARQPLHVHADSAAGPRAAGDDRRIDVLIGQRPDLPDSRADRRQVGHGQTLGAGIDPLQPGVGIAAAHRCCETWWWSPSGD